MRFEYLDNLTNRCIKMKDDLSKLKDIETGKKKRDELTDPTQIARVEAKLKELQPQLKT